MAERKGIAVDLAVDERIVLTVPVDNCEITLTLEHKSGRKTRIHIDAPSSVRIGRPDRVVKLRA